MSAKLYTTIPNSNLFYKTWQIYTQLLQTQTNFTIFYILPNSKIFSIHFMFLFTKLFKFLNTTIVCNFNKQYKQTQNFYKNKPDTALYKCKQLYAQRIQIYTILFKTLYKRYTTLQQLAQFYKNFTNFKTTLHQSTQCYTIEHNFWKTSQKLDKTLQYCTHVNKTSQTYTNYKLYTTLQNHTQFYITLQTHV